jgi:hypothetical protein
MAIKPRDDDHVTVLRLIIMDATRSILYDHARFVRDNRSSVAVEDHTTTMASTRPRAQNVTLRYPVETLEENYQLLELPAEILKQIEGKEAAFP